MGRPALIDAFLKSEHWDNASRSHVAGDASNRSYSRLSKPDGSTAILMDASPHRGETIEPFIKIAGHLRERGLSAPKIFAQDTAAGLLIIEDFGDALFAKLMADNPAEQGPLYVSAVDALVHLHASPPPELAKCDAAWLHEMMSPLFEWYAQDVSKPDETRFHDLFQPLANEVTQSEHVMILRDFHAENLLLLPERSGIARVGLLDFQDAMLGHPAYDLVSILQDARRDVPAGIEADMLGYMIRKSQRDENEVRMAYAVLGVQRNLRILGIFARLCLRDGKPGYVDFMPRVWGYISRNLTHPALGGFAEHLATVLPAPTPALMEHLKRQCQTRNSLP